MTVVIAPNTSKAVGKKWDILLFTACIDDCCGYTNAVQIPAIIALINKPYAWYRIPEIKDSISVDNKIR